MKILIGTNNAHKVREVRQILETELTGKFDLLTPADVFDEEIDVEETGLTLDKNAFLKADEFFSKSGIPCFADDTGLEINALHGHPGVRSARFAGEDCDDAANRKKALDLLKDVPDSDRSAQFRTVICFKDGTDTLYVHGVCPGKIIKEERGGEGFGYDSIFVPEGYEQTFAQMSAELKNKLSHRGKAVAKLVKILKDY